MSEMEFKTTERLVYADPQPPEGKGWRLASSAPMPPDFAAQGIPIVCHYWQRLKSAGGTRGCTKCPAIAFVDGKCLGCGTPQES